MYNLFLTMMINFEFFWTIKDVQNQNQRHPLKGFNTCAFKIINTCCPSYELY
jgi:hypothetical protein